MAAGGKHHVNGVDHTKMFDAGSQDIPPEFGIFRFYQQLDIQQLGKIGTRIVRDSDDSRAMIFGDINGFNNIPGVPRPGESE